jgi:Flp pilus assembly protein CpaB
MVLTAARDVAAGEVLRSDDVTRSAYDPDSVPAGVLDEDAALGRTTTVPLRRGEPVTDVRLVTGSLLEDHPGLVAVPVRIGDAGAVALLHAGDRIDLVAADPQSDTGAQVVARDVPVLAIPQPRRETPGLTNGALVVLGLPDDTARTVAQASVAAFLSVVLKR